MDSSSVASRVAEIFAGSKIEQKRQFLAFVFSNLALRGKTLEFSLASPFDLMVDRPDYPSWLCREARANPSLLLAKRNPSFSGNLQGKFEDFSNSEIIHREKLRNIRELMVISLSKRTGN